LQHVTKRNLQLEVRYMDTEVDVRPTAEGDVPNWGSVEFGWQCIGVSWYRGIGSEGWGSAILSDGERLTHCTHEVEAQIVVNDRGFPQGMLFSFDDLRYHWKAVPRGELVTAFGSMGEGHCQRVGDDRSIVNGQGWTTFYHDPDGSRLRHTRVDKLEF
jgi:hypothetical protein